MPRESGKPTFQLKEHIGCQFAELLSRESGEFLPGLIPFRVEVVFGKEIFWNAATSSMGTLFAGFVFPSQQLIVDICAEFLELDWGQPEQFVSGTVVHLVEMLFFVGAEELLEDSVVLL